VWGYPYREAKMKAPLVGAEFRRKDSEGKFIRTKEDREG